MTTPVSLFRPHIVSIAALGTLVFGWLFTGHWAVTLAVTAGLDWFLVNLVNRVVDRDEDSVNRVAGTGFAAENRRPLIAGSLALLAASFAVVQVVEPRIWPLRVAYHFLGFAYNFPLIPVRAGRRIRLKQVYLVKNIASATGFLLTVFGYPLLARAADVQTSWPAVAVLGGFFFCSELAYEVIYDLRDVAGDRAAGVPTFPVVHGERVGRTIVAGLLGLSVLPLAVGYAVGVLEWRAFILVAGPVVQGGAFWRMVRRGRVTERDCVRLTWVGAGLLLAYVGWVVAGLPVDIPRVFDFPGPSRHTLRCIGSGRFDSCWFANGVHGVRPSTLPLPREQTCPGARHIEIPPAGTRAPHRALCRIGGCVARRCSGAARREVRAQRHQLGLDGVVGTNPAVTT